MTDDDGSGSTPEELRDRIGRLRQEQAGGSEQRGLAGAMALFLSMGISMVGAIYGGYLLGNYLNHRTGASFYLPVMLLLGVAAGSSIVFQMLRPFLK